MKTNIFFNSVSSKKLNETFEKHFGGKIKLEKYTREQLEDMRNKLRTKVFQQEGSAGFNDLLTNETYQKDKAMLQLLNTRIKEMLGEDIAKLRDRLDQINEAKKGVRAPKHTKKSKPAKSAKDYDGDGKIESPKDEVWGSRVKAAAKAGKPFKESQVDEETRSSTGGTIKKTGKGLKHTASHTDEPHVEPAQKGERKAGLTGAERQSQKAEDDKEDKKGQDWEKRFPGSRTVVKGKLQSGTQKGDPKYKEIDKNIDKDDKLDERSTGDYSVKKAKAGKDIGKPGKQFGAIAGSAGRRYGSAEKGKKVAGAVLKKLRTKENINQFRQNVRIVNESLRRLINEDEEGKAKTITAASDMVNDFTGWMQRVGQYQTKALIELADAIRADFGIQQSEAFKQAVSPALATTLETLTQQREVISNAVAVLAGEDIPPEEQMGMEPDMGPDMGPDMEPMVPSSPDELNVGDEFAASDAAAGGEETSGREMRESRFAKRLAESHSIISKLAR